MSPIEQPARPFKVVEEDGVRRLLFDRKQQSSMRLDNPFETDLSYASYLHLPFAVKPDASRALLIGLGGGMLAKRMWRDYPGMHIDAVEVDPGVVAAAHEVFGLPHDERLQVAVADGRAFLEASEDTYDVISIDAFDDNATPRPLMTREFLQACREHLTPDGAIVYNVFGAIAGLYSKPTRSFYHTVSGAWRSTWVFRVESASVRANEVGNIIVLATDAPLSTQELLERIAGRAGGVITVPGFEALGEDLYLEEIDAEDAPILQDPRFDTW